MPPTDAAAFAAQAPTLLVSVCHEDPSPEQQQPEAAAAALQPPPTAAASQRDSARARAWLQSVARWLRAPNLASNTLIRPRPAQSHHCKPHTGFKTRPASLSAGSRATVLARTLGRCATHGPVRSGSRREGRRGSHTRHSWTAHTAQAFEGFPRGLADRLRRAPVRTLAGW